MDTLASRCVILFGILHISHEPAGGEVKVIEPLQLIHGDDGKSWFGYPTDYKRDGKRFCPVPHFLKKKADSAGPLAHDFATKGSWDQVGWSPEKTIKRETV